MAMGIKKQNYFPRRDIDAESWRLNAKALGKGEGELLALFADGGTVNMVLRGAGEDGARILSIKAEDRKSVV